MQHEQISTRASARVCSKKDRGLVLPQLRFNPAHPVEDVLSRRSHKTIVRSEGNKDGIGDTNLVMECLRGRGDAAAVFAVDGIDRHFKFVEPQQLNLGTRQDIGMKVPGSVFYQSTIVGLAAVTGGEGKDIH